MTPGARTPQASGKRHFAIVGAGIAGMVCARELAARGVRSTLLERGPRAGGRLASESRDGGIFDLGAQYLTVHSEAFAKEVHRWVSADLVRSWDPRLVDLTNGQILPLQSTAPRFVGAPAMQSIADFLAAGLQVVTGAAVARVERDGPRWNALDASGRPLGPGAYDGMVLALPSVDAAPLVQDHAAFAARLADVRWDACWTATLALSRPSGIEFDGAFINDDPILAWAARENSKPGRHNGDGVAERWLLHARATWSNGFMELSADDAARWMQRAFAARLARPLAQRSCSATWWRAALPAQPLPEGFLWDAGMALGLAGDWCGGARIESAFLSGQALARAIAA